ncbi:MAG: DUF6015 family protein [Candidatus Thermoplasmatota archaeon]|nr:DUF6015 family protein [Candidatus Thermoplasmatota archaeon]
MVIIEDVAGGSGMLSFPGDKDDVISRYILATAIQRSFLRKNDEGAIENNVAEEMAEHVLNFFGFGERIIDNMLKTDDRDIFYMLEDLGILKTEREETTLYDGREWRINYWTLKKQFIADLTDGIDMSSFNITRNGHINEEELYGELPDDFWSRD